MEATISKITQLWSSIGTLHIEGTSYDDEVVYLEIDAEQFLSDLPAMYKMAKQGVSEIRKAKRLELQEMANSIMVEVKLRED